MLTRIKTAGWLASIFLTLFLLTAFKVVPDTTFSYVVAFCFIMAIVEIICAMSNKPKKFRPLFHQSAFMENGRERSPDDIYYDTSWPECYTMIIFMLAIQMIIAPLPSIDAVFILLSTVGGADFFAFLVGSWLSKVGLSHKVSGVLALVSPNKTYEGFLGGIIGGALMAAVLTKAISIWAPSWAALQDAACYRFMLSCGVAAILGDLLGSLTKRYLRIKNSNEYTRVLPVLSILELPLCGQGGYLDRFDSVIISVMVYRFLLVL